MTTITHPRISRANVIMDRFGVTPSGRIGADAWGDQVRDATERVVDACRPGRIILITGASGSGKSLLLRELTRQLDQTAVQVDQTPLPDTIVCDCLHWLELEDALEVLSRFGLGEVYTYLSPACLLSTGQQFRLRLAMAYARLISPPGRTGMLLADEFATQLDRTSAAIIARNFRRAITRDRRISAIVATCHDDLEKALQPDVVVRCDFGEYEVRA